MQLRTVLILLIALVGLTIANEDVAAVSPSAGSAALPVKQTTSLIPTDAITIPGMLSYQGRLTDSLGNPVPDGNYQLTFRLYQQETGGTPFWTEAQTIMVRNGLFSALLGAVTPITSLPDAGTVWLSLQVGTAPELTPRLRIVSSAFSFLSERAANSDLLQGKDTTAFVRTNQANSITSVMIVDGTIASADIANNAVTSAKIGNGEVTMAKINQSAATTGQVIKWNGTQWAPANDSAGGPPSGPAGGDLTGTYPNPTIANNAVTSAKIQDATIVNADISAAAGISDTKLAGTGTVVTNLNADLLDGYHASNFLTTSNDYGRSGVATDLYEGTQTLTQRYVNEGQAAGGDLTGTYPNPTIAQKGATTGQVLKWTGSAWAPRNDSIGQGDNAWVRGTPDSVLYTIRQLGIARGGANNMLYGSYRYTHTNLGVACTTGTNGQDYYYCTVGGGGYNTVSANCATVGGGYINKASGGYATVASGEYNTASGSYATVGGGERNTASGGDATVGGGYANTASNSYATVAGGYGDTAAAGYSFAVGSHSVVPLSYSNSAAFNGQTATASAQLRCGTLSKTGGSFTIDHPVDPYNKILNHYFIEGPEMRNIYEGSVVLGSDGRAEVKLPDYFSALNRNPHIQLTGVGTSDVYVAEKISGNRFVIGGKPGTEVYWQVTGERADVSAEAIRRMMPVEQLKTGPLAGRMLDDEFLSGCMEQLEREGKAQGINFRTAEGRRRYEQMKNPPKPEQPQER